jgi:hypothetical protein
LGIYSSVIHVLKAVGLILSIARGKQKGREGGRKGGRED